MSKVMEPGKIDTLIIGQGISGTFLSWYLLQKGERVLVIDKPDPFTPSRIAAGVINPVTGRRHVTVWLADELIPFALKAYRELGETLKIPAISQKSIIDFFPSPQMRLSFLQRIEEGAPNLHAYAEQNQFNPYFNYELGCGEIRPAYCADMEKILRQWRKQLRRKGSLLEEEFDLKEMKHQPDLIRYRNWEAGRIIFCDGLGSSRNPYFQSLPFAPNKGEILLLKIEGLSENFIYKRGMMLVPLTDPNLFWLGSDYQWEFDHPGPTDAFRKKAEWMLREWLKLPFLVVAHFASVRPATLERRPFVGMHPHYLNIGILNGMGTKGCSLAPFFANQLANHLVDQTPILPEASVARYSKMLLRLSK